MSGKGYAWYSQVSGTVLIWEQWCSFGQQAQDDSRSASVRLPLLQQAMASAQSAQEEVEAWNTLRINAIE